MGMPIFGPGKLGNLQSPTIAPEAAYSASGGVCGTGPDMESAQDEQTRQSLFRGDWRVRLFCRTTWLYAYGFILALIKNEVFVASFALAVHLTLPFSGVPKLTSTSSAEYVPLGEFEPSIVKTSERFAVVAFAPTVMPSMAISKSNAFASSALGTKRSMPNGSS